MLTLIFMIALLLGTLFDIKFRKIPNWLTFGGMVTAVAFNYVYFGTAGLKTSLAGILIAFVLLFVPFAMGGMGAGDVKFLMLVGAFQGFDFTANTFLNGAVIGGVYSLFMMARHKTLLPFLKKLYYTLFFFTASAAKFRSLEVFEKNEQPLAIPYAVAIAAGVGLSYWLRWL